MTDKASPSLAIAVAASANGDLLQARELSRRLCLPLADTGSDPLTCSEFDALLLVSGPLLALQQTSRMQIRADNTRTRHGRPRRQAATVLPGPVRVDFGDPGMRHRRRAGHVELLGKAVGVSGDKRPCVLDATAGLARDAFILADMGCSVIMCERDPIVAALLESGLKAALAPGEQSLAEVVSRLQLFSGDARHIDAPALRAVDVISMDPMFPPRSKRAAVKKEMAFFQSLLAKDDLDKSARGLLNWALEQDVARVVVKRPLKAAILGGNPPSHEIAGKTIRYDVYVKRALG